MVSHAKKLPTKQSTKEAYVGKVSEVTSFWSKGKTRRDETRPDLKAKAKQREQIKTRMDTGCGNHSHDHDGHDDPLGLSLRPQIDLEAVQCLNEEVANSGRAILKLHEDRLSAEPSLQSQEDDPELLLYIPFTEAVTVQSIAIRSVVNVTDGNGVATAPPRTIKVFTNRDDLDFDTAREMEPQSEVDLVEPHHFVEGTIDYPLRPAGRFQNISSLTVFFVDNFGSVDGDGEDVSTIVTYVGVKGRGSSVKRQAVETVYESQGMPDDHKTKSEGFGGTSEIS